MNTDNDLLKIFSLNIRNRIKMLNLNMEHVQEIRLRINKPLIIKYKGDEYIIGENGDIGGIINRPFIVLQNEIRETMEYISNFSMYAFQDEIRQGYITIQGGHRIGISGKTIIEDGNIKGIRYISSINIRIAHQIRGCADKVIGHIYNGTEIFDTLIISPPGCGKTTLIRDIIRQLSNGSETRIGKTVSIVDERSEIAACYNGIPQNDVGIKSDVLDCCPKGQGMIMMIRAMSPDVIAIDEIGGEEDINSLRYAIKCGVKILATIHGNNIEDIRERYLVKELIDEKVFGKYIVLNGREKIGQIDSIYDRDWRREY